MTNLNRTQDSPDATRAFSLLNLGFRPFYLLASIFAALSVPLWAAQYAGILPVGYLRGAEWHGHEMVFGYAIAVITGFLFTAVRNWTNQPTPHGMLLGAYALLWIAGRILVLTQYFTAAALVNALFPIAVALGIGVPLVRSGNRRNYFFVALLVVLAGAASTLHFSLLQVLRLPGNPGLQVGLDVVLFIMAVIGGRVIPMFTNNGVPGADAQRRALVERLALGGLLALAAADVLGATSGVIAVLAPGVAAAQAMRLYLWHPWRVRRVPLVWILHLAYAWIVVHLLLRSLAAAGLIAEPIAIHALTIGAIGSMTLGMMCRTARGHTGRPLTTDGFELACFLLIALAAVIRVFGALLLPGAYVATVLASAACWSVAFALYAVRYWPVLTRPRVDGRPG